MTRQDSLFKRYELFAAAALIAAHAANSAAGFRQRDVRFLIELFTNWIEHTISRGAVLINNSQVMRYLEELAAEGYTRRFVRSGQPHYQLTRVGLVELLTRLCARSGGLAPAHFFFRLYFIRSYSLRITELVRAEGKQFPFALRLELEALLDYKELLKEEMAAARQELQKLDERIDDALKAGKLARKLRTAGNSTAEIALEIEKNHPYELNSQKPLAELFSSIPGDLARWEMETGALRRAEHLWQPSRVLINAYLEALGKLQQSVTQAEKESR